MDTTFNTWFDNEGNFHRVDILHPDCGYVNLRRAGTDDEFDLFYISKECWAKYGSGVWEIMLMELSRRFPDKEFSANSGRIESVVYEGMHYAYFDSCAPGHPHGSTWEAGLNARPLESLST